MVDSIGSVSGASSTSSASNIDEEEKKKKKTEEEGLFTEENGDKQNTNPPAQTVTEDTAKSTAASYIASLKAQYPQLAGKLDAYYSGLDIATLCKDASSTSDIKAYIFNETQSFL